MSEHLSLSKAARLVGVSRGLLQKKIRDGELSSFDGSVALADLKRVFPKIEFEQDPEYARVMEIKERAFGKRVLERALPDKEILAARLTALGKDLASAQAELGQLRMTVQALLGRLDDALAQRHPLAPLAADLKKWLGSELERRPEGDAMVVRDSALRVLSPHVRLLPSGHEFFVEGNDSILEAALRAGIALDYGCSNGNCGECRAKILSGETRQLKHHDYVISDADKRQGTILLCSHTAVTDLVVEAHVAGSPKDIPRQRIEAKVRHLGNLGEDMLLLHLQTPRSSRLRFLAGQKVELSFGDGGKGELPVASCPCDDRNLQFHLSLDEAGQWFGYPGRKPATGEAVVVYGPDGQFVLDEASSRSLVFIALDRGFAPLKSLVEHAMAADNAEDFWLYWLAHPNPGHYMVNACRAWDDALDNFHFQPILVPAVANEEEVLHDFLERLSAVHPQWKDLDVYCAGGHAFEQTVRRWLLARGLPERQWHGQADA